MKKLFFATVILLLSFNVNAQLNFFIKDQVTGAKLIPASFYGARPGDGKSDKAAMRYLIRKVSAQENTYIVLEPGKYDIKKIRIDYEILQETGRVADTTPTPEGYVKMFYIFLIPVNEKTQLTLIN